MNGSNTRMDLSSESIRADPATGLLELTEPVESIPDFRPSAIKGLRELRLMAPVSATTSLDFLHDCSTLEALYLNAMPLSDCRAIQTCKNLKKLGIGERAAFDFSCIGGLHLQAIRSYSPNVTNLNSLRGLLSLQHLELCGIGTEDVSTIASQSLLYLRLWDCTIRSGAGLERLHNLEHLDLGNSRMETIPALGGLCALAWLSVHGLGGLENIEFVAGLDLEYLIIDEMGGIDSLLPLNGMKNLREVFAGGTTVRDRDFSLLMRLPNLRRCLISKGHKRDIRSQLKAQSNSCQFLFR